MLRRTLVAAGCAALLAGFGAAAAPASAAAASCPDSQYVLQAYNASHAWNRANTRGAGQTIGVIGAPDRVAEAMCAARALAPDATVVTGVTTGIVVVADSSVDPPSSGGGRLVIEAAGDTSGPMPARPPGVVNVAAVNTSGTVQPTSSYGPAVMLAAYGNDTSTAAGYVGALAALLHAENPPWMARDVAAQMAGSIGYLSGNANDDHLGFGNIEPDQAVSVGQIPASSLPERFAAAFPATLPPPSTAPSTRSVPSGAPSPGAPTSGPTGAASTPTDSGASGSSPSASSSTAVVVGSANPFPTIPVSTGPSNGSHAAAGGSGGSGGFNPVLLIGFLVIVAGGGYVLWQRRRRPEPAAGKPESEWEAPSGPRHSGYSPPEE